MTLPPLPARRGWIDGAEVWALSDVHTYGLACRTAALEEAAKVCEELPTKEGFHSAFRCAAAIRALQTALAPTPSEPA